MSERSARLDAVLDRFAALRILVVGDVLLDEYLIGAPTRVSREAPVLILEQRRRFVRPGGGANPAVNVLALGAAPRLVGVVGDDAVGRELRAALDDLGIVDRDLIVDPAAQTTLKTRLLAETSGSAGQQVVRLDRPGSAPSAEAQHAIIERIQSLCDSVDAVLLSDYKAGVIGAGLIQTARSAARARGKLLSVDSQGGLDRFRGFDLVKCNRPDAESFLGRSLDNADDYVRAGTALARELEIGCLMITLGGEGISVSSSEASCHIPASNRTEVFDVTGAGDTVAAVATLALAASANHEDAAYLANLAAGEVVRRLGVTTTSVADLRALLAAV
ncbi:MAG TPA: PfkB family carbohydrate kinase [Chloroflexota bacterium]|jgi:rfaE bifunctional protein kinase chain/domain|nr:PfkB family carbohydrate kinase [Chloroflexota bacterium]